MTPQLYHLDGRPQTWDELQSRVRRFHRITQLDRIVDLFDGWDRREWWSSADIANALGLDVGQASNAVLRLVDRHIVETRYPRNQRANQYRLSSEVAA